MNTQRLIALIVGLNVLYTSCSTFSKTKSRESFTTKNKTNSSLAVQNNQEDRIKLGLRTHLNLAIKYAQENGYCTEYFFLIDMGICSGKNRFFVYDKKKDSFLLSGLVAHGGCHTQLLEQAKFSNTPECGCSSLGRYKVGNSYRGEFGKSYRLYGLDSSNSNAFKRSIILHGFGPIPDQEIYPRVLCNSFGCPMVSRSYLNKLSEIIDNLKKPVLLWVYN